MNEICFNDLSIYPLCDDELKVEDRIIQYSLTLKAVGDQGIKKVRYKSDLTDVALTKDYTLQDYVNSHITTKREVVQLIISMATKPQVPDNDDIVLKKYLYTYTYINKEDKLIVADGFNAAFSLGTYCIGFYSEPDWSNLEYDIAVIHNDITNNYRWCCVSLPTHLDSIIFNEWREQFLPINLIKTNKLPSKKEITLVSTHHGNDKLFAHAQKLVNSPYIEGVLTSLEFDDFSKTYISKKSDFDNGLIDVVLYWEERGYSMRIKTTGRNYRETLKIAEILNNKYGKR